MEHKGGSEWWPWLLAFGLACALGLTAALAAKHAWVGAVAGVLSLWLTAVFFAFSRDRVRVMTRGELRDAEIREALDVLRGSID